MHSLLFVEILLMDLGLLGDAAGAEGRAAEPDGLAGQAPPEDSQIQASHSGVINIMENHKPKRLLDG